MSSSASHQGCGEPKNQIPNFRLNLLCSGPLQIFPPQYSALSSHHHRHLEKLLKDMTASTVSFQCCCRQAGRPPALSSLFVMADTILPPGEKDRSCETAAMQCQIRESGTRTYVEFCGLPQKSSGSGNGSDSDSNRERHIQGNTGANRRRGRGGEHSCVAILRARG